MRFRAPRLAFFDNTERVQAMTLHHIALDVLPLTYPLGGEEYMEVDDSDAEADDAMADAHGLYDMGDR